MREIIGVESWISVFGVNSILKKEALFFDKLAIPHLSAFLHILKTVEAKDPQIYSKFSEKLAVADCLPQVHYLLENGFLFETTQQFDNQKLFANIDFQNYLSQFFSFFNEIKELMEGDGRESVEKMIKQFLTSDISLKPILDPKLETIFKKLGHFIETTNRMFAIQLREVENLEAYPILVNEIEVNNESEANKTDIIQITLNNLPMPNELTSWSDIKDFRNDEESKQKFVDLRNWMNEVAQDKLSPLEIEQKLEYLISQYQRQLKIHDLKTNVGTMEIFLVSGAEFLEELVRFKFSKIAKTLFSIKHKKIELMEKELTANGSEIAYIIKAKNEFNP